MRDVRAPPSEKVIMPKLQQEVYLKQNSKPIGCTLSTSLESHVKSLYKKYIHIHIYIYEWTHMHTHTDMMTPTGLMRWELICDSDGATFVKSDSQLQQPGWRDNSLPVRLCVHRPVCVCTCTRVCL